MFTWMLAHLLYHFIILQTPWFLLARVWNFWLPCVIPYLIFLVAVSPKFWQSRLADAGTPLSIPTTNVGMWAQTAQILSWCWQRQNECKQSSSTCSCNNFIKVLSERNYLDVLFQSGFLVSLSPWLPKRPMNCFSKVECPGIHISVPSITDSLQTLVLAQDTGLRFCPHGPSGFLMMVIAIVPS